MTAKIFVLGRPGTGKSSAARLMIDVARKHGWDAKYIDDYDILYWMFLCDMRDKKGRFRQESEDLGGFHVVNPVVLDEALLWVRERAMHTLTRSLKAENHLVVIEFARSEYKTSLEQFGRNFLQDSYFLFLNTDVDTCAERIYRRAEHRKYKGDHYIAKETIEKFYAYDDIESVTALLKIKYGLDERRIKVIENVSSEQAFLDKVRQFIESIIEHEMSK